MTCGQPCVLGPCAQAIVHPVVSNMDRSLKIGIYRPLRMPESFRVCVDNIGAERARGGVHLTHFDSKDIVPDDVDCYWDPRSGGGSPPAEFVLRADKPCVVTVHGVAPMEIPFEYGSGVVETIKLIAANRKKRKVWRRFGGHYAAIVTGSQFSKVNIAKHLPIDPERIFVGSYAVNHDLFKPRTLAAEGRYFLHVSNNEPRKNLRRIVAAYRALDTENKPGLWLKLRNGAHFETVPGVQVIDRRLGDGEIAELYAGAFAFVFPSLYEGFGLPILEAMASGCPVITSDTTACAEVAGGAAITVNPRSVDAISGAMQTLCRSEARRKELIRSGLSRAKLFTWEKAGEAYRAVFEGAARASYETR